MSANKRAAGGGLITTAVLMIGLSIWGNNPGVAAQIRDIRDHGFPTSGISIESIDFPGVPKVTLPKSGDLALSKPQDSGANAFPAVSAAQITKARSDLAALRVTTRSRVSGYSRAQFGQGWTDDNAARLGHNGCDTRNDVLKEQLRSTTFKPGTRNCVIISGVLTDPYTAKTINFTKASASAVQIDHVAPLSLAWDLGASTWDQTKRVKFANDPDLNLLASDGPANMAKGDKGPGAWMPPNKAYHCTYAVKFITVAKTYGLKLNRADKPALEAALRSCR